MLVTDFAAFGDNWTDNTSAILAAIAAASSANVPLYFPPGTYVTQPIVLTAPLTIIGTPQTRIKLTGGGGQPAVLTFDFTAGAGLNYGVHVRDFILDGMGLASDGLLLKNVISSEFTNLRVTNVSVSGFHLTWAQLCEFRNPTVSGNVEAFSTIPANGILVDASASSANTFVNPCIEHVSGSGILAKSLINSTFVNGSSEGNAVGIELGETSGTACTDNTFVGMDLENNSSGDIIVRSTATANLFVGVAAGFLSGSSQILGARSNTFLGGTIGALTLDGGSVLNRLENTLIYGPTNTISDAGTQNSWLGIYNISTTAKLPDKPVRQRQNSVLASSGTVTPNNAAATLIVVTAEPGCTALTVAAPLNPIDGAALDFIVHNNSGGPIAMSWDVAFQFSGWADPATNHSRAVRFVYDGGYGAWYAIGMSAADQPL